MMSPLLSSLLSNFPLVTSLPATSGFSIYSTQMPGGHPL